MIRIRLTDDRFKMVETSHNDRLVATRLNSFERSNLRAFLRVFILLSFLATITLTGLALTLLNPFPASFIL